MVGRLTDVERIASIREVIRAASGDWHEATALWSVGADLTWLLERAEAGEIDVAWAEVTAALPEGWAIEGVVTDTGPTAGPDEDYAASAGLAGEWLPMREGRGKTPAAALRALAKALRETVR